ncbi:hypothetical protein [Clostridium botulinum]|uniref:Uncharacterized protein n=2 Tax=Clostridium botulinum TaxID=1491 RepID=A7GE93_CLOBL|nr:hypothetical protein [Clostridium botulinum]ABS39326.1 hypothetical protein CLI_1845 [Clostridium botulinum F str. Langeland]ADF99526.1 hypothetical protein CBF_1826 [Clostridium botulinum F str. 230613]KKM42898.1 hypothetical protein VT72_04460 [Clostridium botulinum]MBY6791586.1 hypothetical protein [Clostridium botulinum]MBY6936820.1 hypothetical protein [Clostridium botulinum]
MRSFGLVEYKIYESDYFLEKINECINLIGCQYLFSAFVSACRSITFSLQSYMNGIEGFFDWYANKQEYSRKQKIAKKFVEMRNESQKVGVVYIGSRRMYKNDEGAMKSKFFFMGDHNYYDRGKLPQEKLLKNLFSNDRQDDLEEDVATQCERNFKLLLEVIKDYYTTFGHIIDPEKYYTIENIGKIGLEIEDFEESVGFPRGYTCAEGLTDEIRIALIRENEPKSEIYYIFNKYFEHGRYE